MPTFYDDPAWVVRDRGSAFGTRKHEDTECRWRVQSGDGNGVHQWGDGQEITGSFGPVEQVALGRTLFEFDANRYPVGISLNSNKTGDETISLTAENGSLVIRNEYRGLVLAIIDSDGIHVPENNMLKAKKK